MVGADTPLCTHLSEKKGWEVHRWGAGTREVVNKVGSNDGGQPNA